MRPGPFDDSLDGGRAADLELVQRSLTGDPRSLHELTSRMASIQYVLRAINRRFSPGLDVHELADLQQDVATLIWQKLQEFEGRARLESWFYRFCLLEYMNHWRSARRRRRNRDGRWPEDLEAPTEGVSSPIDAEIVERSLAELGPPRAEVIREHYYSGRTFEEIGRLLSLPLGTVKTHYYRGMDWLRQRLEPLRREELR